MNGIQGELAFEDARAIAEMLVRLGKAIAPEDWIDWMTNVVHDRLTNFSI